MRTRTARARRARSLPAPQGLQIDRINPFLRAVQDALAKTLNLPMVIAVQIAVGRHHKYYFRTQTPVELPGEQNKPLLALPLHEGRLEDAWLVVEIKCDQQIDPAVVLTHVSLKLYAGPTSDSSKLYFRAEWDARDNPNEHAQPHWNIHDTAWSSPIAGGLASNFIEYTEILEPSFTKLIAETEQVEKQDILANEKSIAKIKKFHFAMAALWHNEKGQHAIPVDTQEQLCRWISGCAGYIKTQMQHLED